MRKSGGFAFICYLIYTILGVAAVIYNRIGIEISEDLAPIGYAILFMFALVFAAASAVGLILKLLHMGTGFGLFGFLCILVDIAFIVFFGWAVVENASLGDPVSMIIPIAIALISGISFISNIRSLKN